MSDRTLGHGKIQFAGRSELEAFNADIVAQLRANDGKVTDGLYAGADRFLLLHTVGAKSGEPRVSPLFYLDWEGHWYLVGSFWGNRSHPAWVYNLRANPKATVEIKTRTVNVIARELTPDEHIRVWAHLVQLAPVFAEYQLKTERRISLFELTAETQVQPTRE
ncbi:nitroreductase family deazaflavin-dependent oxidoreductase [Mycobacteroides sp. LB1]|uniref:nitroreductase family deazaflavin-dependent oxidoreductase n=1 Tax=Mycobacteroides sp. LB1 TaxID=2750814 RepID=UPI0015DFBFCE|nr:nitroreductase family deazaflavin-dependent oxidoreductase [Mycobacteroides sp. LB1]